MSLDTAVRAMTPCAMVPNDRVRLTRQGQHGPPMEQRSRLPTEDQRTSRSHAQCIVFLFASLPRLQGQPPRARGPHVPFNAEQAEFLVAPVVISSRVSAQGGKDFFPREKPVQIQTA